VLRPPRGGSRPANRIVRRPGPMTRDGRPPSDRRLYPPTAGAGRAGDGRSQRFSPADHGL
jgi:hypothetical protein